MVFGSHVILGLEFIFILNDTSRHPNMPTTRRVVCCAHPSECHLDNLNYNRHLVGILPDRIRLTPSHAPVIQLYMCIKMQVSLSPMAPSPFPTPTNPTS